MKKIIGSIGLGNIGEPMAINLIQSGYSVIGFDVIEKPKFVSAGGLQAKTIEELSKQTDLIVQSLPTVQALETTVDELIEFGRSGQIIIELSSYPLKNKKLQASRLAEHGITMLDCEISGLPFMVKDRSATIFQSGDQATIESTQVVFEAMTNKRINLGKFGAATKMKLLANMMVAIHNSVAGEVLNLAQKADIDLDEAIEALSKSAAGSVTFSNKAPIMITREFESGAGPFRHMFNYLRRVSGLAKDVGASTPLLDTIHQYYEKAEAEGRADQDIAAIIEMLEEESNDKQTNK
ncbi:NAD(P)-dependent oxidoreductase [Gammaproteobacteria bacterium]|mgnify:FL=1|jgi:3-hydroxyisobutyrate dehydrogenase-like beta-hydroxyacid dehydrogenase|nr:NAD(P)-dependent oxidoreductase [Gammaproteobacteria bacterium]|tara:strand:- start:1002 stop:1883 length:882 start_codon:yes stop_codon:yes gene_type:complete